MNFKTIAITGVLMLTSLLLDFIPLNCFRLRSWTWYYKIFYKFARMWEGKFK